MKVEALTSWDGKMRDGARFAVRFRISPDDLETFFALSGDRNPIHTDEREAVACPIGGMSTPGFLGALVFSRVLGTMFPGYGTVYRAQSLDFQRPMSLNKLYEARFCVEQVIPEKHLAKIDTQIIDKENGQICTSGTAVVLNNKVIG